MGERHDDGCGPEGGISGFLRTLLSGIPWSERAEGEETLHMEPPQSGVLRIDNANGRTRVVGEERKDLEIRLYKAARAESEEQAKSLVEEIRLAAREDPSHMTLDFDVPRRWNRRGRVDVEARVPRGLKVEVFAANGRVCVSGMRCGVRARSSNGMVRIEDVVGDIDVATSNAKVRTCCTCGRMMARSSNGKIELEDHRGSVDASTSNGTIHCELEDLGQHGVMLTTSNGRIVLELPDEVDGDVDMRVDNGVIRSSRDLGQPGRKRSGRMRGTLGRGGIPIKLRASNGSISLR